MLRTRLRLLRLRSERGAVMVELAIVAPLIVMLAMGIFEFGVAYRSDLSVGNAGRSGARIGSNAATHNLADHAILSGLGSAMSDLDLDKVNMVVVYRADDADGEVPPGCITSSALSAGGSNADNCNTYDKNDLMNVVNDPVGSQSSFDDPNCVGDKDAFWCSATERENSQGAPGGPDYLGVYISYDHDLVTGLFGATFTITDHTVMRLEPEESIVGNG
ncbi:MAG: hypothetical protein JJLCMIEE_00659 [Acidimicrobiales bacterium]|nr:MAG: pilus assembly protein [Actinomycetota bacterium]MBV6507609.1 hypothetical protein [Acidimicrobiales bacterium]RIK07544.1 MAG: hypothetical protein DCC48_03320 [Acidobacteriota bacterium]